MYCFEDFANELERLLDTTGSYNEIIRNCTMYMKKLISNRELISQQTIDDIMSGSIDNTVYSSKRNDFVVQIFTWNAKSITPVHDHDTWGVMGIYYNKLFVTEYSLTNIDHNSYDINVSQEYLAKSGDVCYLIPPDEEIHKIENITDSLSISIHVYGKPIKEYNVYDLENGQIIHNVV